MLLDIIVAVMAVIAVAAFIICWRMENGSQKGNDEEGVNNIDDTEKQLAMMLVSGEKNLPDCILSDTIRQPFLTGNM